MASLARRIRACARCLPGNGRRRALHAGGPSPLSVYVTMMAVPMAWRISLAGIVFAIASRGSVPTSHYLLALVGNLITLALGCAIWFFLPVLVA
jgi:hypothetical protein